MVSVRVLAGAAVIGFLASPALTYSQAAQAQQKEVSQKDLEFAKEAAEGGMMEVELGKLAQQQAQNQEVVQFGQRMVDDHGKANAKLKTVAEQKGIQLPTELPADAQQKYDELQQVSDAEFDKTYMDEMVQDHEKDIAAFEKQAQSGQDPELRAFAEETLPTLREHLDLAKEAQSQVTTGASESTTAPQQTATPARQDLQLPPEDVVGSNVVNAKGDDVGEIEDLVVDQNQARYAIVSVGGFLGIGDKEVAIPLDQLEPGQDQSYLLSAATEEQLEQMPAYEGQYQSMTQ
jgi:putative membrane protein